MSKQTKAANRRAGNRREDRHIPEGIKRRSLRQRLTIAFVSFQVVAIFIFAMPLDISPARALRNFLSPYMLCIGMNEAWDMFAPNPKSEEQFLKAIVVTRSGNTQVYSLPRMENLSLGERYRKERYRKFSESVLCNECSGLWPDIEKAVARQAYDPADPPAKVILVKFESPIDPITGTIGNEAAAKPTVLTELFVQPEDLR